MPRDPPEVLPHPQAIALRRRQTGDPRARGEAVDQPAEGLGAAAAAAVLAQLRDDQRPRAGIILPTPVVWRDSA